MQAAGKTRKRAGKWYCSNSGIEREPYWSRKRHVRMSIAPRVTGSGTKLSTRDSEMMLNWSLEKCGMERSCVLLVARKTSTVGIAYTDHEVLLQDPFINRLQVDTFHGEQARLGACILSG